MQRRYTSTSWNADLGVPGAHVIGQQPETLALAYKHLLWDELEGRVVITLCSSLIVNLLQLLPYLLSLIPNSTC